MSDVSEKIGGGVQRAFARLGAGLTAIGVGALAGLSVLALGTSSLVLVPALVVAGIMLMVPYSPLIAIIATLPINVEIAGPITVARLAIVYGVLVAYWQGIRNQAPMPRISWPEGTLGALFFIWIVIASVAAPGGDGLLARVGPFIIFAAIYFVIVIYVDTPNRFRTVLITIVTVGIAQGALVLMEAWFNFVPFGGWQAELAAERGDEVRVVGASSHPIVLAGFLQVALVSALLLFATSKSAFWRLVLIGATGLFLVAWWYTFARSSWPGMVVILGVAMLLMGRTTRIIAVVGGTIGFVLLATHDFSPSAVITSLESIAAVQRGSARAGVAAGSESFSWRSENWYAAISMWQQNPIFGVGFDGSVSLMLQHMPGGATAHQYIPPAVPHNIFLQLLAETGMLGFLLYVLLWLATFNALWRSWSVPELRPYVIAFAALSSGLLTTFFFNPMPREVWFAMAMALALGRMARNPQAFRSGETSQTAAGGASRNARTTVSRDAA